MRSFSRYRESCVDCAGHYNQCRLTLTPVFCRDEHSSLSVSKLFVVFESESKYLSKLSSWDWSELGVLTIASEEFSPVEP